MADSNPIAAQSNQNPSSKDNDDKQDDDEFEDSLNISISEHISEEIENDESNLTSAEDSIEQSKRDFVLSKRRQLFDIGDDEEGTKQPAAGSAFSKFDIDNDAADNIAQHFIVDDNEPPNEPKESPDIEANHHSLSLKITEEKSSEVEAAENDSVGDAQSAGESNADQVKELNLHESDGAAAVIIAASGDENDDVILINDHEISIHSLKKQQTQRTDSHSPSDPNVSPVNQNTTSDISDLLNENSASQRKDEIQVKSVSQSDDDPNKPEATTSAAGIESATIDAEVETVEEKQREMKEIIHEAVDRLPIDRTFASAPSASAPTTDSEQPVSSAVTEINYESSNRLFESEVDINLLHMQNKIRELQNIAAGKYHLNTVLNLPADGGSSSRRDSLKDFPQSGRESTSITTNSTEYKTFQEEYLQVRSTLPLIHLDPSLIRCHSISVDRPPSSAPQSRSNNPRVERIAEAIASNSRPPR